MLCTLNITNCAMFWGPFPRFCLGLPNLDILANTSFDLQKNLMHAGVDISSSTVRRLLEAVRKATKPL